jgi:hypothetical protein
MLVLIEDGEAERRRRLLPGRPTPYQRLPEPKHVPPIRQSAVEEHQAIVDSRFPLVGRRMPVASA